MDGEQMNKKEMILGQIKKVLLVSLGTVVLAFGTAIFIIPMNIVTGGISGIAIIIDLLIPFGFVTVDMIVTALTWLFFFMGLILLGKDFAIKTLISTLIYPIAISVFLRLTHPDVLGGFFCVESYPHPELSLIMSASVGGVIIGIGCALTFLGGGSTGGVDVISFVICKYVKKFKSSVVIFIVDALTIIMGMFVLGDLMVSLLGIFSASIAAIMIDKVFLGGNAALVAHIVTDKYEIINQKVIEKLDRTTTIVDAVGGYKGEHKKLVMVSFTRAQYADLLSIVNSADSMAFLTIHQAQEVKGLGWTR